MKQSSKCHSRPVERIKQRWIHRVLAATTVCTLAATLPRTGHAANYVVTLSRGFIERAVEDAINQTVLASERRLYWGHVSGRRVEVTRKNSRMINIDLDLAFDAGIDPEVDVDIELAFNCFWSRPDINVTNPRFDVDVSFPWYVNVLSGGLSWVVSHVANVVVDKKVRSMDQVRQQIVREINERLGGVGFEFCPAFNVTSGGDVQVIFGPGSECTSGQQRHKACTGRTQGSGINETCINGYWERTGGVCEPIPPPGGHPL